MKKKVLCIGLLMSILGAAQVQAKESEDASSISIIGGADGPTSIFFAGKVGDGLSENPEETAEELYALKTEYVGNAPAIGSLIVKLTELNYLSPSKGTTFEILSEEEPYGLRIILEDEQTEREKEETDQMLTDCGTLFLALIDNLSEVQFTYPLVNSTDGEVSEYTLSWDLEDAEESLGKNVKDYGADLEAFEELMTEIQPEENN